MIAVAHARPVAAVQLSELQRRCQALEIEVQAAHDVDKERQLHIARHARGQLPASAVQQWLHSLVMPGPGRAVVLCLLLAQEPGPQVDPRIQGGNGGRLGQQVDVTRTPPFHSH